MHSSTGDNGFLSYDEYKVIAIQTIKRFCPSHMKLLSNYEAMEYIIQKIMWGDWKWEPDRKCSRKTYRCHCAQWAAREYVTKVHKRFNRHESLEEHHTSNQDVENWRFNCLKHDFVLDLDSCDFLTPKEKTCIQKVYFQQYRIDDVVEETGISKPSVYLNCSTAIKKLQQKFGV